MELKGLSVRVPPRLHFLHTATSDAGASEPAGKPKSAKASLVSFEVDSMEVTGAELVMETDKPGKLPLDFQIARIKLTHIASGGPMGFDADLTNPRPKGTIKTTGSFGRQTADPGESPLTGNYSLEDADLASFKGIAGILSSTGHYQGTLRHLAVDGQADVPDFRLTHFGTALSLTTRFHARVDGTNGDTRLEPVEATLGSSHFTARGADCAPARGGDRRRPPVWRPRYCAQSERGQGTHRGLSASGQSLRQRAVDRRHTSSKPCCTFRLGPAPVHERLNLDGQFALDNARFASEKIQRRILELSLRGQGRPHELKSADPAAILSRMQSSFQMADGVVTLPAFDFRVPGAAIQIAGYVWPGGRRAQLFRRGKDGGAGLEDSRRLEGIAAQARGPLPPQRRSGNRSSHPHRRHTRRAEVQHRFQPHEALRKTLMLNVKKIVTSFSRLSRIILCCLQTRRRRN